MKEPSGAVDAASDIPSSETRAPANPAAPVLSITRPLSVASATSATVRPSTSTRAPTSPNEATTARGDELMAVRRGAVAACSISTCGTRMNQRDTYHAPVARWAKCTSPPARVSRTGSGKLV